jgi:hypothetical protein
MHPPETALPHAVWFFSLSAILCEQRRHVDYGILMLIHEVVREGLRMKNWLYRWGPAILFMAIIFIASATPGSEIPGFGFWDFFAKKGGHLIGYALLAAAYYHALNNGKRAPKLLFVLALCMTALYAASDEWHQRFTPGRSPSLLDVGIDITGSFFGALVSCLRQKCNAFDRSLHVASKNATDSTD